MNIDKLNKANILERKIADITENLRSAEKQNCEWIIFTFGNGSNRANVCNSKDIIKKVRLLIIEETQKELFKLQLEFDEL